MTWREYLRAILPRFKSKDLVIGPTVAKLASRHLECDECHHGIEMRQQFPDGRFASMSGLPTKRVRADVPTMLDAVPPRVLDAMNGAALDTLWREFDPRNDLGHTNVLVLAGNRHRK